MALLEIKKARIVISVASAAGVSKHEEGFIVADGDGNLTVVRWEKGLQNEIAGDYHVIGATKVILER